MADYEYWRHKATQETYAVRLKEKRVVGYFRLPPNVRLDPKILADYRYQTDPEQCRALEAREGEFLVAGKQSSHQRL